MQLSLRLDFCKPSLCAFIRRDPTWVLTAVSFSVELAVSGLARSRL
jgi:hypothetical protein